MDQIITFDKSYQQRFQEYMDVLSGYEVLAANQVKREWGCYLELVMDPNGWQAVWKIPRITCEKHKILFPTIVLVYVENIDFRDLTAFVKILAVQDDIHLPESHVVPLIQLWPTKDQDDTVCLNLQATANGIDMLHFFYTRIWMPWDTDDEENVDWLSKYLEIRLRLYYDIKTGVIPRHTAEHLQSLITEAKSLQLKRVNVEEEMSDEDDIDVDLNYSLDQPNVLNENIQTLMNVHIRMIQIKNEVEILENPVLRSVYLKLKTEEYEEVDEVQTRYWIILKSGSTADEYIDFLQKVKEIYPPETKFKSSPSIQNALETANPKDIINIIPGEHNIRSVCALEEGGVIKGLERNKTELISTNENVMLDFSGENVVLENLTINTNISQCGLLVRKGHVKLVNCTLIGKGESSVRQGIIVLPEAELHMENCKISGFAMGIVASSNTNINLQNVDISEVDMGIKIHDKSHVNLHQCTFTNCKQYGLFVERDSEMDEPLTGGLDVLDRYVFSLDFSVFISKKSIII